LYESFFHGHQLQHRIHSEVGVLPGGAPWEAPDPQTPRPALTSVAATLPLRSRDTKRLTMGLLILWVARMRARGHQKLSIFLMVASPCRENHTLETGRSHSSVISNLAPVGTYTNTYYIVILYCACDFPCFYGRFFSFFMHSNWFTVGLCPCRAVHLPRGSPPAPSERLNRMTRSLRQTNRPARWWFGLRWKPRLRLKLWLELGLELRLCCVQLSAVQTTLLIPRRALFRVRARVVIWASVRNSAGAKIRIRASSRKELGVSTRLQG